MERPDAATGGQVVNMGYYNDKQRSGWAVIRQAAIHGPWIAVALAVLDFIGRALCTR